jgi:phosphatase NudJ
MSRPRIPSHFFVFVVVEHEGKVLVVREAKHGRLWYAPAGGLEAGETIREAAIRETMEEAGIRIEPTGLLRVDQQWFRDPHGGAPVAWFRFVVSAVPVGSTIPKATPDRHSLEARWVRPHALREMPLRHEEVLELIELPRIARSVPLVA